LKLRTELSIIQKNSLSLFSRALGEMAAWAAG